MIMPSASASMPSPSPVQFEACSSSPRSLRERTQSHSGSARSCVNRMMGLNCKASFCFCGSTSKCRISGRWINKKQLWYGIYSSKKPIAREVSVAVDFPNNYSELLEQVEAAAKAALSDSKKLLEIEFPTAGLASVPGDLEGGIEMSRSMELVQLFCQRLCGGEQASRTRIFFPDLSEVELAKSSIFEGSVFKLDYLSNPSGWEDIGFGKKVRMSDRVRSTDRTFVIAYPYFNVNEMLTVEELFKDVAQVNGCPIIVFNGELDRIRSGYYPSFFYPKLGALAKSFLPQFETVYYIHNFKGRHAGTLFRVYPGPWQVLCNRKGQTICIHEQVTMPTLKEVSLDILPSAFA